MQRDTLVISQGASLPPFMRALAAVVGILIIVALPIALVFFAAALATAGTEIDKGKGRLREYNALLSLRWGKWENLGRFAAISVLRTKRVSTMYSRSQRSQDLEEWNFDVVLLDKTHRKKQVVKACYDREEAMELAKRVAAYVQLPLEAYSPEPVQNRRR